MRTCAERRKEKARRKEVGRKRGTRWFALQRRCLGFSSAEAFDIFSQGEDLERWPFLG